LDHQGTGFKDVCAGGYFPAISLFKNVTVSVNFGPNFKFAPKEVAFRGVSDKDHAFIFITQMI
jgi:Set1/Ash2 histone methyltransferase complex subunit ASH2